MKKSYVKMFFVVMLCMAIGHTQAQGLKGALNKAKGAVNNVTNKNGTTKADEKSQNKTAKPLAPEVKNAVSEIRSLTGLTQTEFDKKAKSLGYTKATDGTGLYGGGTIYKSKTNTLSMKMGTRGDNELSYQITKYIYNKKPNLATMKVSFLNLGKQCTDLKAEFEYASIEESGKILGGVRAKNVANRNSKFLPALDNLINAKKDFLATDEYTEEDYTYKINFYFTNIDGSAMVQFTVTDNTIDSMEG